MKSKFLFFALFVLVGNIGAKSVIEHIEPTYWWVGMHNPSLQIMIHGKDIAKSDVAIKHPGIRVSEIKTTDNPNFIFLYININKDAKAGIFDIELKTGKKKQTLKYELKERKPNSANREGFSEKDNLYMLMPDRFANGNPLNDEIKGYHQGIDRSNLSKRQGGDIAGISQKIPYLADLGITALWTTPMFADNDTAYSYHHYAAGDYYRIDPRFGTNDEYLQLCETANANGIKMVIDMVPNHCGGSHWWVKDLPAKDWFHKWDNFTRTNYRTTAWSDPYASQSDLKYLTKGWFDTNMPDLNLSNPLLFDYLKQAYLFWIEAAGIAGIRVDTYPYNELTTAARFIQSFRDEYPKMNIVGECWVKSSAEAAFYQSGSFNNKKFDSRLQSVMDFTLSDILRQFFNEKEGWDTGTARFYNHFAQDFVFANPNLIMNFADNHDMDRLSTAANNDVRKYKMALAMLATVRGYPQIYYGTEIMIPGIAGDYQGHRFTFPGGWQSDKRDAFAATGRSKPENEVFDYLKKLLNYRKASEALQSGNMMQFIPENGLYVFFRYNDEKTIMVVCNNNEEKTSFTTERFAEKIGSFEAGVDIISRTPHDLKYPIDIEAKSVLILELTHWL